MSHLLDRIAAFLDGELDDTERDRVMVHLASCAECRAEVAAHRELKSRLARLAPPEPSADLLAGLRRLAEPGEPLRPPAAPDSWPLMSRRPTAEPTRPPTVGVRSRPASRGPQRAPRRPGRRLRGMATTGLVAVTATLVTAFAVGGSPTSEAPPLTPDVDTYLLEHAETSRGVPFSEVPADVVDVSFRDGSGR